MHACTKTKKQVRMNLGTHAYVYVRKPQMLQVYMSSTTAYMFGICVFPHTHKMRSRTSASPCRVICPSSAPSVLPSVCLYRTLCIRAASAAQHSRCILFHDVSCLLAPAAHARVQRTKGCGPALLTCVMQVLVTLESVAFIADFRFNSNLRTYSSAL